MKAKVTFENEVGEKIVIDVTEEKDGGMKLNIDFGKDGSKDKSGLYCGLANLFMKNLTEIE